MTNFEKYKDKVIEIRKSNHEVAIINGEPVSCVCVCHLCDFENDQICLEKFVNWLFEEYQEPKLTKQEREFLECFTHIGYKEIFRTDYGVYVSSGKREYALSIAGNMFPFIKPGETWTFENLLNLGMEK